MPKSWRGFSLIYLVVHPTKSLLKRGEPRSTWGSWGCRGSKWIHCNKPHKLGYTSQDFSLMIYIYIHTSVIIYKTCCLLNPHCMPKSWRGFSLIYLVVHPTKSLLKRGEPWSTWGPWGCRGSKWIHCNKPHKLGYTSQDFSLMIYIYIIIYIYIHPWLYTKHVAYIYYIYL